MKTKGIKMKKILVLFAIIISTTAVNSQSIYSKAFGNPNDKPLIYLHGGPGYNSAGFEVTTAQKLSENGFYVITYDRRGEGRSPDKNSKFTFNETFDDINLIYDKFNLTSEFDKKSKKKIKHNRLNIGEMSENLDVFYISEKLKLYTTLLSWKRTYKLDIEFKFINEVIGFVKSMEFEKYPPIAIWYQIFLSKINIF